MKSTLTRLSLIAVLTVSFCLTATAQSSQNVPIEYLRPMKNSFSIGVRSFGGAKVTFGGQIGSLLTSANYNEHKQWQEDRSSIPAGAGFVYANGAVGTDSGDDTGPNNERPPFNVDPAYRDAGNRWHVAVSGTGSAGTPVDVDTYYLDYDSSGTWTRNWSANSTNQIRDASGTHQIAMSSYSVNGPAPGTNIEATDGANPGIEMQMGRVIQRFKRFEWGINFTIGISELNAKTRQTVNAVVDRLTDLYQVYSYKPASGGTDAAMSAGQLTTDENGAWVIKGPQFDPATYDDPDAPGETLTLTGGYRENTTPLGLSPVGTDNGTIDDGSAQISGYWQIKGVYYVMRIGPMARIPVGRHFSVSFGAGYMGAWIGSKFRLEESLSVEGSPVGGAAVSGERYNQQYLSGFYADANVEWWLSTRTGFFGGVGYEKLGSYTQTLGGRTASIKMDNGLGYRFGIITRF